MKRNRLFVSLAGAATAALLLSACGGISDDDREQASEAALSAVGGGRVTEVDEGDSDETAAYNVEVALDNGESVDVELDEDFGVLNDAEIQNELQQQGGTASDDTASESPSASASPSGDASPSAQVDDDTPLEGDIKAQAEQAALDEVGQGRVTESTYADPNEDHVYEVEVDRGNDDDVTVELAEDFSVVRVDN